MIGTGNCGSHSIQSSQRVSEMRVGHVRCVNLTKLSSQSFLLSFRDATLKSLLVAATVLPHIVASPDNDEQEFESQRYSSTDSAGDCACVSLSLQVSCRSQTSTYYNEVHLPP